MCQAIEEVPPQLASFGEQCPCHFPAMIHMNNYSRRKFIEHLFGDNVTTCPCAGMVAPELVSGQLHEYGRCVWQDLQASLRLLKPLPGATSMSASDWDILCGDCEKGQKHMMALLQLKTNFWTKLPWMLAGLAHADISVARRIAREAIQQFDKDPRKEVRQTS